MLYIRQYSLILLLLLLQACAHFDTSRPGWASFATNKASPAAVTLHSQTLGHGTPVILIHGFAANSYSWRNLTPALSEHHDLHVIDLKGFGKSPKPDDGAYSVYDQARLLIDYIQQRHLKHVCLVGHSFGGGVALVTTLYMQKSNPNVIRRLVLIDSIAYKQDAPLFISLMATPVLGDLLVHILPIRWQVRYVLDKAYYNDELINDETIDAYAHPFSSANARNVLLTAARQIFPSDLETLSKRYAEVNVPSLIIWGKNDAIAPLRIGKRLHKAIRHSSLMIIDKCGHIPQEECPDKVVPEIVRFLADDHPEHR